MAAVYTGSSTYNSYETILVYSMKSVYGDLIKQPHCLTFKAILRHYFIITMTTKIYPVLDRVIIFEYRGSSGEDFTQISVTVDNATVKEFGPGVKFAVSAEMDTEHSYTKINAAISNIKLSPGTCLNQISGNIFAIKLLFPSISLKN